jgi:hypothetical protein
MRLAEASFCVMLIGLVLVLWTACQRTEAQDSASRDFNCTYVGIGNLDSMYRCENAEAICYMHKEALSCMRK